MALTQSMLKTGGLFTFLSRQSRSIFMAGTAAVRFPVPISRTSTTKYDMDEYDLTGAGEILFSLPVPNAKCLKAGTVTISPSTRHGLSGTPLMRDASEIRTVSSSILNRTKTQRSTTTFEDGLSVNVTADLYGESFQPGCWVP